MADNKQQMEKERGNYYLIMFNWCFFFYEWYGIKPSKPNVSQRHLSPYPSVYLYAMPMLFKSIYAFLNATFHLYLFLKVSSHLSEPKRTQKKLPPHNTTANFPLARIFSPYFQNKNGKGIIATHKKANRLVAQSTPRSLYMYVANKGKPAAMRARAKAVAARALLAFMR